MVKIRGVWSEVTLKWSARRVEAEYRPEMKARLRTLPLLYVGRPISDVNEK